MEGVLRNVCKDIKIGKILIQADRQTGDPQVRAPVIEAPLLSITKRYFWKRGFADGFNGCNWCSGYDGNQSTY